MEILLIYKDPSHTTANDNAGSYTMIQAMPTVKDIADEVTYPVKQVCNKKRRSQSPCQELKGSLELL